MKYNEAMRAIMSSRGYSQKALADELGMTQGAIASVMRLNNPTVDAMNNYLSAMGYGVALVPAGMKLPDGCYMLESGKG